MPETAERTENGNKCQISTRQFTPILRKHDHRRTTKERKASITLENLKKLV